MTENCFTRLNRARERFHTAEMEVSEERLQLGLHEPAFERFSRAEIRLQELIDEATTDEDSLLMGVWANELEAALYAYQLASADPLTDDEVGMVRDLLMGAYYGNEGVEYILDTMDDLERRSVLEMFDD